MENETQICVIDFETLGTDIQTAPLLALGVVIGNVGGVIQSEKEFIFNLPSQLSKTSGYQKRIDESTLQFWTSSENQVLFSEYMQKCAVSQNAEEETFLGIHEFLMQETINTPGFILAAYHGSFDTGLLKQLYKESALEYPFSYRAEFDFATVRRLCKSIDSYTDIPFVGTKHNALDDARHEYNNFIHQLDNLDLDSEILPF